MTTVGHPPGRHPLRQLTRSFSSQHSWPARMLAGVLALGLLIMLAISPTRAAADPLNPLNPIDGLCKTAPAPVRPDRGVAGMVTANPDLSKVPDNAPNPFALNPDGTYQAQLPDVYGYGYQWDNYALGCGSDLIRDPQAALNTSAANQILDLQSAGVAAVQTLTTMTQSLSLTWLYDLIRTVAQKLQVPVLGIWLPLAVLLVGILLGWQARRNSYADTLHRAGVVLVGLVLAVVALVYPVQAARGMDHVSHGIADATQGVIGQGNAADSISRQALYQTWLVGNFGSATSPTAVKYGPRLLSDTAFTWSDIKRIQADPAAQQQITRDKAADYTKLAATLQTEDPSAYQTLTGKDDTRAGAAAVGIWWVLVMGFFVALANLMMILARLIMVALVIAAGVGAVVGVLKFAFLQKLWDLFTAAAWNIAKFTLASGVMSLIIGGISTANLIDPTSKAASALTATGVLSDWRIILALVATVIAIMLTKPISSFKAMVGMDVHHSMVAGLLKRAVGTAVGYVSGMSLAGKGEQKTVEPEPEPADVPNLPVEESMPALPLSRPRVELSQAPTRKATGWVGAERYAATGDAWQTQELPQTADTNTARALPAEASVRQTSQLSEPGRSLPSGIVSAPRRLAITASSVSTTATRPGAEGSATSSESYDHSASGPIPMGGLVDPAVPGSGQTGQGRQGSQDEQPGRVAGGSTRPEVLQPTGIWVQNDYGLYRSYQGSNDSETYIKLHEKPVDADGAVVTDEAPYRSNRNDAVRVVLRPEPS